MCKLCNSKSKKQAVEASHFETFRADVFTPNEDLVVVAAKSSVNIDTAKGSEFLRAGGFTSIPKTVADKLVEQGAPIWII